MGFEDAIINQALKATNSTNIEVSDVNFQPLELGFDHLPWKLLEQSRLRTSTLRKSGITSKRCIDKRYGELGICRHINLIGTFKKC